MRSKLKKSLIVNIMFIPVLSVILEEIEHKVLPPEFQNIKHINKNEKYRIINDILHIDNRKFKWFMRFLTGDSRYSILLHLKRLKQKYANDIDSNMMIRFIVENLKENYSTDKVFIKNLELFTSSIFTF